MVFSRGRKAAAYVSELKAALVLVGETMTVRVPSSSKVNLAAIVL